MEKICDEDICAVFSHSADFERRELACGNQRVFGYFIDGLVSGDSIAESIYKPIAVSEWGKSADEIYVHARLGGIYNATAVKCETVRDVSLKLVNGFCVTLFPNGKALAFEVKTGEKRNPSPPEVENTIKGSKDAFVETLRTNTSLTRRHLRDPLLKIWETDVGTRSITRVAVIWLEGITNPDYVKRMQDRIDKIQIDGFITSAAVEECITGFKKTAFPLLQFTERTDMFCKGILDGRVGVLVDGLPIGYLAPVDLKYLMETPEDQGRDYISASFIRGLRYIALFVGLILPGVYISVACFEPEAIPLPLLRTIIESKKSVPFSTVTEVIALLIAFVLLQEAGIHLPQALGQAVSIIGGIVVGTAAVEAKLISPAALISVSIAGVCGFVLPNQDLSNALMIWRFLIAAGGAIAGLFGVTAAFLLLMTHLSKLKSLDVEYLAPFSTGNNASILRQQLNMDKNRDTTLHPIDRRRQN